MKFFVIAKKGSDRTRLENLIKSMFNNVKRKDTDKFTDLLVDAWKENNRTLSTLISFMSKKSKDTDK